MRKTDQAEQTELYSRSLLMKIFFKKKNKTSLPNYERFSFGGVIITYVRIKFSINIKQIKL